MYHSLVSEARSAEMRIQRVINQPPTSDKVNDLAKIVVKLAEQNDHLQKEIEQLKKSK